MSRPRTSAVTATSRLPFSRLTWFGPSARLKLAMWRNGIVAAGAPGVVCGKAMGRFSSASMSLRNASGRRTMIWKRRSPSNTRPAARPPMAMPTASCTSERLRPRRAISPLSILISRKGSPDTSSTLTLAAPSTPLSTAAIWLAARTIGANSSPNTLTARSSRTPAMSSLKRIPIGRPRAGKHESDLRKAAQHIFIGKLHRLRLRERCAGNPLNLHHDVFLVENRRELLAETCEQQDRAGKQKNGYGDHRQGRADRGGQCGTIGHLQRADQQVLLFLHSSGDHDRDHRRHEGQGKHEGAGERDEHGERHRRKCLAFDAGEGEKRNVNEHNDCLAVDRRLNHLLCRGRHGVQALAQ